MTIPPHILHAFWREEYSNQGIAFEGLIGVGKSTLTRKIKHIFQDKAVLLEENIPETFLQLFYDDPARYAFALQTRQLQLRKAQQKRVEYTKMQENKLVVWDRSILGDYIFTVCNYMLGSISDSELEAYQSEFVYNGDWSQELQHLNYVVFLFDEPENCKKRVEEQRQHMSERAIPLAYYDSLDQVHFSVFLELLQDPPATLVFIPWGNFHQAEDVLELLREAKQPSVVWSSKDDRPKCDVIYTGAVTGDEFAHYGLTVALEARKNQLSAEEAGVAEDRYIRKFYNKNFRKLFLTLLAQGCSIILY